MIWHQLNRTLELWRAVPVDDGAGGQARVPALLDAVLARLPRATGVEQRRGGQTGATLQQMVICGPGTDLRRGDELRDTGLRLRVVEVLEPSQEGHIRAVCERIQAEPRGV